MAFRKKETDYFELLLEMVKCTQRAAVMMSELMNDFTHIAAKAEELHKVEHEGDGLLHDLIGHLNRAFITPIDREDILQIGSMVDTITDNIEDVANMFDMLSITEMQHEAKVFGELIVRCCDSLSLAMAEFHQFKHSKKLNGMIINVNHIEEEGDRLYRRVVKALYLNKNMDTLEILKWKEIYDAMENVLDACEDVANILEGLAVKNG